MQKPIYGGPNLKIYGLTFMMPILAPQAYIEILSTIYVLSPQLL